MKKFILVLTLLVPVLLSSCSFRLINPFKPTAHEEELITEYFTDDEQDKLNFLLTELVYSDEYNDKALGITYPTALGAGIKVYMGTFNSSLFENCSDEEIDDRIDMTILHEMCHVVTCEHSFECNLKEDGIGHSEAWLELFTRVVHDFAEKEGYTFASCYCSFLQYYTKLSWDEYADIYGLEK